MLVVLCLLAGLWPQSAAAQAKRIALVIGNSEYDHVASLNNPANDATDLAAALERIGFTVTQGMNLDYRQMRLTLRDFAEAAQDADMVIVYFAGHGIEIENTNYLIPVNAELRSDRDVDLEALRLESFVRAVSGARGLKLILVDACRNNPFLSDMVYASGTRSVGRGLARVDPSGVLVGYAARSGTLAMDGDGRNSPYARALLSHIEEPGLELGKMFRRVRDTVWELTDGAQEPFTYGSLPGRDIFLMPPRATPELTPDASGALLRMQQMVADFAEAEAAGTDRDWTAFLGRYADLPDNQLMTIAQQKREAVRMAAMSSLPAARPGATASGSGLSTEQMVKEYSSADAAADISQWTRFIHRYAEYPDHPLMQKAKLKRSALVVSALDRKAAETVQKTAAKRPPDAFPGQEKALGLTRGQLRGVQSALNARGFDAGPVDGLIGARTRNAISVFQSASGLAATGVLNKSTLAALNFDPAASPRPAPDAATPAAQPAPAARSAARDRFISGREAEKHDADTLSRLHDDPRLTRVARALRGQAFVYGYFEDRLYVAVQSWGATPWAAAVSKARALGGHLATMTSRAENQFVYSMVQHDDRFWRITQNPALDVFGPAFGLAQSPDAREPAGGFAWVTGEALAYTNWGAGEPNNYADNEDIVTFTYRSRTPLNSVKTSARWGDYPDADRGYIMEFP
ncbi:caspase family protein [Roseobacter ponti]|uniref:Caspase family p20 domain-containing protein n=1 Tax=Roseobacter ponti TaxID=1891787 RepID=A0A858SR70_9RHOB|nr:caspase family protein [Roseobacter ponti]QJF50497.1 hypothetical protein G3256_04660 [Roseobacter ponti]